MKTIKLFTFAASLFVLGATSCIHDTIKGNGVLATEGRITTEFDKVKSSGAFEVHITKGTEYEIIVSAEENIIPYIETHISDGILKIDNDEFTSIRNDLPMEIFITTPELEGIKLSGSGLVTTDYFISDKMDIFVSGSGDIKTACDANSVEVTISGSGTVEISGTSQVAEFEISGSGDIKASNLDTDKCYSAISGSGDVWTSVDQFLSARISGSGNVFYYGEPVVDKKTSGSGNVVSRN